MAEVRLRHHALFFLLPQHALRRHDLLSQPFPVAVRALTDCPEIAEFLFHINLGDGYWKMDELDNASATWHDGLEEFPDNPALRARLSKQGDDLKTLIDGSYDPNKRVDTSLQDLWTNP